MNGDQFVPKVHPLSREVVPDDPLELMAQTVVGDPDVMLECILQEFVWMGWSEEQLLSLFHHPGYPVLCQLREFFGDAEVARRVSTLLARGGQWRFRETIAEPDPEDHHGPELLQITLEPAAHH
jgi:hypothetical protein